MQVDLSWKGIKPVGLRAVYEIREEVKIPIIGVGGITSGLDAIEYLMAGASAVQLGSVVRERGTDVFSKVCREMEEFMSKEGYRTIKELIGIAHRK